MAVIPLFCLIGFTGYDLYAQGISNAPNATKIFEIIGAADGYDAMLRGSIVSSTTEIVRNNVNTMKTQVVRALQQTGIDYKNVPGIQEIFQDSNVCMNPFAGISTAASQSKFYKINFGLVVSILHYMPAFIIPCG